MYQESAENTFSKNNSFNGCIEIICGSMFSGKTEELMRRIRRVQYANLNLQIFKPDIDTRYIADKIVSHDQRNEYALCVKNSKDILSLLKEKTQVIAIDEAQFFDEDLPEICKTIANKGIRVIIAGLDTDYLGVPFGVMPTLLAQAEYVTKLHAICAQCGSIAQYTHRLTTNTNQTFIGSKDEYEPLCRACYVKNNKAI